MTTTAAAAPAPATTTWHLTRLLAANAAEMPDRVALREKRHGLWRDITWADYAANVEAAALGLLALGVQAGDRVAIQADNRPEWLYVDLATVSLRGCTVGLYPTNPESEVRYLVEDSGAVVLVAEDQEQVDKALAVIDDVDSLRWVVSIDSSGMAGYHHPALISYDELVARGEAHRQDCPTALAELDSDRTSADLVALVYTSGTTGPPKGAMLSAENVAFSGEVFALRGGMFGHEGLRPDDVVVSYLPLSHVVERAVTTWCGLRNRTVTHFAESIDTVSADLAEVQPSVLFAVPRIWEKMQATVTIKMASSSPLKQALYSWSMALGRRGGDQLLAAGGRPGVAARLNLGLAGLLAGRKVRRHLGMARVRHAISGAAPISPDTIRFFASLGVVIHEAYGMTENTAIATATKPGRIRVGTVGEVQPGAELRLDPTTGEVLTRHRGTFVGYWGRPEATAETVDPEGWLHTGDIGEWVDGSHLRIVDRIKDIIITAGGKNVSPSEIENLLKASPYVREAVVVGDGRPYLTAVLGIEHDTVADWASRRHIEYTTYRDLSTRPEVIDLMTEVVRDVNTHLARVETIRKYRMLPKELDHEDGELTATQKLKRSAFLAAFPELVDDMYAGGTEHAGADLGRTG